MRHRWLLILVLLFMVLLSWRAAAAVPVPEPLRPWVDWVLHDAPQAQCPFLYNAPQRHCAWPARLELQLNDTGGEFTQQWQSYAETWLHLPGDPEHWPQSVTANGEPALVSLDAGRPALRLPAGSYRVAGRFLWERLPETLLIPPATGLLALSIDGAVVPFPDLEGDGRLWLRGRQAGNRTQDGDRLELQVFRRIVDDNPLQVLTRIEMDASGVQREVTLDNTLLQGFLPLRISSKLPARLEPDGRLRVQVRPGRWTVEIAARATSYVTELSRPAQAPPWPGEEVWVFKSNNSLRLVEPEGLASVDPGQTRLPQDWRNLPAWRVLPDDRLRFKVIRRGDPEPAPDRLLLDRSLWLDFDGKGYTLRDRISGTMTRAWRLEVQPDIKLGQIVIDGMPQLITTLPDSDKAGVEVRRGTIALSADSRYERSNATLPATGWDHEFQQVSATLNLPPGWKLLAASGVDQVTTTWLQRWTLLDLFLVLIGALAVLRLWGWPWGLLALLTLGLIWHEPDAPRFVWLNILAAIALLRVLPSNRFRSTVVWYRNFGLLTLAVIAVPFLVNEVRTGIYPQLAHTGRSSAVYDRAMPAQAPAPASSARDEFLPGDRVASLAKQAAEMEGKARVSPVFESIDPKARIQTGPGLPDWRWTSIGMSWNGPVERGQSLGLTLLSPPVNLALNLLRVLLVSALALRLLSWKPGRGFAWPSRAAAVASILLLAPLLLLVSPDGKADYPDAGLLQELRTRLLEPPECLPACAQIPLMRIVLNGKSLQARLEVHALVDTAVVLPADTRQWLPAQVTLDGSPAVALFRTPAGELWIELPRGQHQLTLAGTAPARDTFQLPLPLRPRRIEIDAGGWAVAGLHEDGVAEGPLQFTRVSTATGGKESSTLEPGTLPPFVRVERTLRLGLDWSVETRVVRLSPAGNPIVLDVPLLDGESVISDGVRVNDGQVQVSLPAGQQVFTWSSRLDKRPVLTLRAPDTLSWSEVWQAEISPVWHVDTSGIAVTHHQDRNSTWLPQWLPWPREEVALAITRPDAIPGPTLTIDASRLEVTPGIRSTDSDLTFALRSSQGGQHTLRIPQGAQLQSVSIDSRSQPIRQEGRAVTLPVSPGTQQVMLQWREAAGVTDIFRTPAVDLGAPSVNSSITLRLGENRWLLWTDGPRLGPAVLYWSVIVIIVLVSAGLARTALTPLRMRHWFLLGIGLSQSPVQVGLVVVGWLLALGLRVRLEPGRNSHLFNLAQIALALLTLVALTMLYSAVETGLLGLPEMQVAGNDSTAYVLNWYQDRSGQNLPQAWIISVPILFYRFLMLAWALWLALALLRWLKWGWTCFTTNGLWHAVRFKLPGRSSPDATNAERQQKG
ncbi:MAG: hypothetical protein WCH04_03350 [Gammaproteobacteria bacterium]